MKKILCLVLALCMVLALAACGGKTQKAADYLLQLQLHGAHHLAHR